ncbi:MAG: metal-dependent hydrolase [Planctomycetales bacterium]
MAGYKTHITVSSLLGVGVGAGAVFGFDFTPAQGILAGVLTSVGGMLPDLDSQSGRPVRELFSLTAALAPMVMMRRLLVWGHDSDGAMLLAVLLYVAIRYGGAKFLGMVAVHRGMFHSFPAMIISGELAFLGYIHPDLKVKFLMAVGLMLGFLSHLVLDEIWAVEWHGARIGFNKFAGTAMKMYGNNWPSNIVCYGLLFTLTWGVFVDGGLNNEQAAKQEVKMMQEAKRIEAKESRRY